MNLKGGVEGICTCYSDTECKDGLGMWGGMHTKGDCAEGCYILGASSFRFNYSKCLGV